MLKNRLEQFRENASWLRKTVLYHRGKHNKIIKENTIKAFENAKKDGLGIELDVRLSKDNKVVVVHDSSLVRLYGIDKKIEDSDYLEICKFSNNEIPLLTDALKLINDEVGIMIEIKAIKGKKLEEETYKILKKYKGRYVIVSFNPFSLRYFYKRDPQIIRGQLSYNYKNSNYNCLCRFLLRRMWLNVFSKPHFISYGIDECDYDLLEKYRRKGYFIIGWTYKDEKEKSKLTRVYDNMIIENMEIKEF